MKASELKKKELTLDNIYEAIQKQNEYGHYKHHIPHWIFLSDETKLQLVKDGFKVYIGNWDGVMTDVLIIEW